MWIYSKWRDNTVSEILFLKPVFKHTIWGGAKLRDEFCYDIGGYDIGECWGIAAHPNGDCKVISGQYADLSLSELWEQHPELFGDVKSDRFPLLVKIIDAKEDLSIQVHPDDAYAHEHENGSFGKTECWYILDCDEDATLVVGHNAKTPEELKQMVENGQWNQLIREVPIKKGDFIQINPGMIHAIKGGVMLLETQQNSDITYRVYDYDRLSDGKPRELHIEKSLDVIFAPAPDSEDLVVSTEGTAKNQMCELIRCPYYTVFKLDVDGTMNEEFDFPFLLMSVTEGAGTINGYAVKKGSHVILPNGFGRIELKGKMQMIASHC